MSTPKLTLMLAALVGGLNLACWAIARSDLSADPTIVAGALAFFGFLVLALAVESAGHRIGVALVMLTSKVSP